MLYKKTFPTEHLQTTAFEFLQKDYDKCKECQTNESINKIQLQRKKGKHGTEGNKMPVTITEGSVMDVWRDSKCDSVWEGFRHWGFTRESWTPPVS